MIGRCLRFQIGQATMVFLPAGSLSFWQGWSYIGLNGALQIWRMIYFYLRDPEVLERRLLIHEKNPGQKVIIVLLRVVVCSTLLLSGLDHRVGWTHHHLIPVPLWLTLLALLFIIIGQYLMFMILQTNRFAASIIQVETGQTIVSTGLYRFVRHPMYLAFIIHWLAAPLALGSLVGLAAGVFVVPVFVLRLLHEE
jgi:protein-S-isoprenylcysteine O-methyltransferase Ste14